MKFQQYCWKVCDWMNRVWTYWCACMGSKRIERGTCREFIKKVKWHDFSGPFFLDFVVSSSSFFHSPIMPIVYLCPSLLQYYAILPPFLQPLSFLFFPPQSSVHILFLPLSPDFLCMVLLLLFHSILIQRCTQGIHFGLIYQIEYPYSSLHIKKNI